MAYASNARLAAQGYTMSAGMPAVVYGMVPVDETFSKVTAVCYDAMPMVDGGDGAAETRRIRAAYQALGNEVFRQYNYLLKQGFVLEAWAGEGQPYANSTEMMADVIEFDHLYYFTGGDPNPYMDRFTNNIFRAVHDVMGHAAGGFNFGPRGEWNAMLHHMQMFSPLAQMALLTETHGQNSWVNYGPVGEWNRRNPSATIYAPQKAGLLPDYIINHVRSVVEKLRIGAKGVEQNAA